MASLAFFLLLALLLGCILGYFFGWMLWVGVGLSIILCILLITGRYRSWKVPGVILVICFPFPFLLGTLIGEGHHLGSFFLWLGHLLS